MPITALPTPPTRNDPDNFAVRGDAFMAALPTFVTEANALSVDVNDKAAICTSAAQAVDVTAWVSGTTYAQGVNVYDTTDLLTYRRKVAGAGTTRPGLDSTNWRLLTGFGDMLLDQFGPLAGLRNLIINGNFAVNQRGYVSGTATVGANQYTLDRWRVVTSGQNATFTASGNGNSVTAPAGGIEQVIEGANVAGGTYVVTWTGTATCTVGGTARTKGETFTLTANTNVTVRFSSGTVSQVQVEPGTVVTPFEGRPLGMELALCQRYFETGSGYGWGYAGAATNARGAYTSFRVTKRAVPTVSALNIVYGNSSTMVIQGQTVDKFGSFVSVTAPGTYNLDFDWTASAEL